MNISSVMDAIDATLQSPLKEWQLLSPVVDAPRPFFREIVYVRFTVGGVAEGIRIDEQSTSLEAFFKDYTYDAKNIGEAYLRVSASTSAGKVVFELDAPRQVRRVRLASGKAPSSSRLEFYRLDGETLSVKPTVAVGVSGNVATIPDNEDFTDVRFAVRLIDVHDSQINLNASDVLELTLRGYPTGPRIGVVAPDHLTSPVFFWSAPGLIDSANAAKGSVTAGQALAKELQRYLDGYFSEVMADYFAGLEKAGEGGAAPTLPEFIDAALVFESDSPCILDITALNICYHLMLNSFSSNGRKISKKQTLRFSGDRIASEQVFVELPRNAVVASATLEIIDSLGADRLTTSGEELPAWQDLAEKTGAYVEREKWAAQVHTPSEAISVTGVALGLMNLKKGSELQFDLQEDYEGRPSGKSLAGGNIELEQPGRLGWFILRFPEAVVLSSQPYWMLVKAAAGQAVWLTEPHEPAVQIMQISSGTNAWNILSVLKGRQGLHRFFSKSAKAQENPPSFLSVGNQTAAEADMPNGNRMFDLAPALNAHLGALSPGSATVSIPLDFRAAAPGIITVYPPKIEYDY